MEQEREEYGPRAEESPQVTEPVSPPEPQPSGGPDVPVAEDKPPARSAFVAGSADDVPPPRSQRAVPSLSRIYLTSAGIAAAVSLFAAGMFFAGFYTREVMDDEPAATALPAAAQSAQPAAAQPTAPAVVDVSVDDDPARGPDDAAVTIIEFSDFQCPYCGRFFQQTLPQLMAQYGNRVRFVYRDFPLDQIHPNARNAAMAAECADDQGKFWEYHDVLFSNQQALGVPDLKRYAEELGLDAEAFAECLDSQKYNGEVDADLRDGLRAGVTGTPTFFINGKRVVGAQPLQTFQTLIEQALAE